jgi:hypothetical protein
VLLTKASVSISKWVPRAVAFARELTPPIAIVPLIAESDVQSPLLEETLAKTIGGLARFA